jgi:large subunit ribosomal protein L25
METVELKGVFRKEVGKKFSRKLREEEKVPCIIYGGKNVKHFSVLEKEVKSIIYTEKVYLLKISLDGGDHNAILQDIQFHPVTDRIIHMDFIEISEDKPVIVTLPIKLTGDALGIKEGGRLRLKRRGLRVKGYPKDLPDYLEIDITNLDIGQSIKIGDLSYKNLEILDPSRPMVVAIVSSRLIAKGMKAAIEAEEAAAAAAAEIIEEVPEEEEAEALDETPPEAEGAPSKEDTTQEG